MRLKATSGEDEAKDISVSAEEDCRNFWLRFSKVRKIHSHITYFIPKNVEDRFNQGRNY